MQTDSIDTKYLNTDFDLKSKTPFDNLHNELEKDCSVLHYSRHDDGHWYASVESAYDDDSSTRGAEKDILAILEVIDALSPSAKAELDSCNLREFNIGFECGDTWAYVHTLPHTVVRAVADADCSLAVTLYPARNPDGTPKT